MTLRKVVKIVFGLLIVFAVAIGLTSINHPIILKWVTGSARHHGKPMPATVYSNGRVTDNIKVFYTNEANNYLLSLQEHDNSGMSKFIHIDLNEKWIGRSVGTTKDDYDIIAGHLFQSETDGHFSPFQDNVDDSNFDPQLSYSGRQIKFNVPSNKVMYDSVRIELP